MVGCWGGGGCCCFEVGFYYIVLDDLELAVQIKLTSNSRGSAYLCLLSVETKDTLCHHTQSMQPLLKSGCMYMYAHTNNMEMIYEYTIVLILITLLSTYYLSGNVLSPLWQITSLSHKIHRRSMLLLFSFIQIKTLWPK